MKTLIKHTNNLLGINKIILDIIIIKEKLKFIPKQQTHHKNAKSQEK